MLDEAAAEAGCVERGVMGMAHRGPAQRARPTSWASRYDQLFKEFEGNVDPDTTQGSGDVKYHLGQTGKFVGRGGNTIPVELAANPSATSRRSTRWSRAWCGPSRT